MHWARRTGRRLGWLLGWVGRSIGWSGREVWWWLTRISRLWWNHKIKASLYPATGVGLWHFGLDVWSALMAVPVLGFAVWARVWPVSYNDRVGLPLARRRVVSSIAASWPATMEAVGLARRTLT